MKFVTNSSKETFELGKKTGQSLKNGDTVALYGGLGSGKTVFAKGIAKGLGIKDEVVSPTFTLLKKYEGKQALYHFDLYRIDDEQELFHIGFYDYIGGSGICVIEWADHANDLSPCISVHFDGSGDDTRSIKIEGTEDKI